MSGPRLERNRSNAILAATGVERHEVAAKRVMSEVA
jgi:hypothetical protein